VPGLPKLDGVYAQLDAVSPDFALADAGLVYVFVCFDDFTARAVLQSG
jgi:hypothetical protein